MPAIAIRTSHWPRSGRTPLKVAQGYTISSDKVVGNTCELSCEKILRFTIVQKIMRISNAWWRGGILITIIIKVMIAIISLLRLIYWDSDLEM